MTEVSHKRQKSVSPPQKAPEAPQQNFITEQQLDNALVPQAVSAAATGNPTPKQVMALQRTVGNQVAQRLLKRSSEPTKPEADSETRPFNWLGDGSAVQAQLTVGPVDDAYEREADQVARQVVNSMPGQHAPADQADVKPRKVKRVQRKTEQEGNLDPAIETGIQRARGAGRPLDDDARQSMEQAFGADFGDVQVHTDAEADRLSRSIQARAFTTRRDIFFRQGEYQPQTTEGRELLAHELTHVLQQDGAEADAPAADDAIQRRVGFEFEDSKWRAWKKDGKNVRAAERKEELHQGTDFKLEGDDTPGEGLANIEFVTEPFEASPKGKSDFSTTMNEIKAVVNRIEENAGKPGPGADQAVKSGAADMTYKDKNYVTSGKHKLSAADTLLSGGPASAASMGGNFKMQATTGVALSDITTMMETFGKPAGEAAEDTERKKKARANQANQKLIGQSPAVAREAVRLLSIDRTNLSPPQRDEFKDNVGDLVGLLSIVIMYIKGLSHVVTGAGGAPAPAKYRIPFLGRNDLGQLFATLPNQQKLALKANDAVALIANVLAASNATPLVGTDTGLAAGSPLVAGVQTLSDLTIGVWLKNITLGTDLLKQNSDALFDFLRGQKVRGGMPKYMRGEVETAMEQTESFGTASAPDVSDTGKALALFENRGIQPAFGDIGTDEAFQIGLNYIQFFIDLAAGNVDDDYQYPWEKPG